MTHSKLLTFAAAAALAAGVGAGPAKADVEFPFDTDLVGYWAFDTPPDDPVPDVAPSGVDDDNCSLIGDAAYEGGTSLPPVLNNVDAFSVDGDGDYCAISFAGSGDLDFRADDTAEFTVAAWVNPSEARTNLVWQQENGTGTGRSWLFVADDGSLRSFIAGTATQSAAGLVPLNEWTHVALTFEKTAGDQGDLNLFVDGTEAASATRTLEEADGGYRIGAHKTDTSKDFKGILDEVRVYDVALNDVQIALLGNAFPGSIEKELVNGPRDEDFFDILGLTTNATDDAAILIGHDASQHFAFSISITADTDDLDGFKVFDVVPAEFDPDGDGEDFDRATTGEDGIHTEGHCTATINPPDPDRKLDPHFIRIELGTATETFDKGETCEVTVWVKTSENPASGKGNKPTQFEPTSCDVVMEGTTESDPDLFNTITLNEGVKVFDPTTAGPDSGLRLTGPVGSLQLTGNGCAG